MKKVIACFSLFFFLVFTGWSQAGGIEPPKMEPATLIAASVLVIVLAVGIGAYESLQYQATKGARGTYADPTVGLVVNRGAAPMILTFYDQAGIRLGQSTINGASPIRINNRVQPRTSSYQFLYIGRYYVEAQPFSRRSNGDTYYFPKQRKVVVVDYETELYDGQYVGWIVEFPGVHLPSEISIKIWGKF